MLYAETLQHVTWACLHFIFSEAEPATRAGLHEQGFLVFEIRGTDIEKKEDLLCAMAGASGVLPQYQRKKCL